MCHHVGNPVDGRPEGLVRGLVVHASIASHRTKAVQARVLPCTNCVDVEPFARTNTEQSGEYDDGTSAHIQRIRADLAT